MLSSYVHKHGGCVFTVKRCTFSDLPRTVTQEDQSQGHQSEISIREKAKDREKVFAEDIYKI